MEAGHDRGLTSVFGPVRVTRLYSRNRREPNLYPADARQVLPDDPYSLGMRALAAFHLAAGGFGQAQEVIEARTGVRIGRAQLASLADDLAAWTNDFYEERARDAGTDLPGTDVVMMQANGKGIAMRPERRKSAGSDAAHPGIRKMAEIVAVADFTLAVREPEDIAAPRPPQGTPRPRRPGQMGVRIGHREHRGHDRRRVRRGRPPRPAAHPPARLPRRREQAADHRHRGQAKDRGLKVPVLIDYIHVSGYLGKAAALHPSDPVTAGQWADGQLLRVRISSEPNVIERALAGTALELYRDHAQALAVHHHALIRGRDSCYLMYREYRRSKVPVYAVLLHVSNPDLFHHDLVPLTRHLLLRHRLVATLGELRIIAPATSVVQAECLAQAVPQCQPGTVADRLQRERVRARSGAG